MGFRRAGVMRDAPETRELLSAPNGDQRVVLMINHAGFLGRVRWIQLAGRNFDLGPAFWQLMVFPELIVGRPFARPGKVQFASEVVRALFDRYFTVAVVVKKPPRPWRLAVLERESLIAKIVIVGYPGVYFFSAVLGAISTVC